MSRTIQTTSLLALVLLFNSCTTRGLNTEVTSCVYPDSNRIPAPSFICDQQLDGYPVTALRSQAESDRSASEISTALLNDQIATWAELWSNDWYLQEPIRQKAKAFLSTYLQEHARVIRSRTSPKNTLWLLIGIDQSLETVKALTEGQVSPS